MSLTANGLQQLMTLCEEYSRLWRFQYNPVKSKMLFFDNRAKGCKGVAKLDSQIMSNGQCIKRVFDMTTLV